MSQRQLRMVHDEAPKKRSKRDATNWKEIGRKSIAALLFLLLTSVVSAILSWGFWSLVWTDANRTEFILAKVFMTAFLVGVAGCGLHVFSKRLFGNAILEMATSRSNAGFVMSDFFVPLVGMAFGVIYLTGSIPRSSSQTEAVVITFLICSVCAIPAMVGNVLGFFGTALVYSSTGTQRVRC